MLVFIYCIIVLADFVDTLETEHYANNYNVLLYN